jgi:PIN domain nuclease of toxin-antitoxin system
MSRWVLDASAILAFLNKEPGTEKVAKILAEGAVVSTVNHSEVIAKLIEAGVPEAEVRVVLGYLNYTIIHFDEESAWATARLRTLTKTAGLSLGDRACLGLALQLNLPVATADRVWEKLSLQLQIEIVR